MTQLMEQVLAEIGKLPEASKYSGRQAIVTEFSQRGWFVSRNQRNLVVWTGNSRTARKL